VSGRALRIAAGGSWALAAALWPLTPAGAQQRNLYVGIATGLVQRGIVREPDAPTWLAGLDVYPAEGWRVGLAAGMLRAARRSGQSLQLTGQLSYDWALTTDWRGQLGLQHYEYPLDPQPARLRYDALGAALAYRDLLSLSISASPNARAAYAYPFQNEDGHGGRGTLAYDLAAHWPLRPRLFADAGVGYQDLRRLMGDGYAYGHLGASLLWGDAQLALAYVATDARAKRLFPTYADNRWVFSLVWHL